jgi:ketosteroid isomerase-like protein
MSEENVEIARRAFEVLARGVRYGDPGAAFDQLVAEGLIASDLDWGAGRRAGVGVPGMGDAVGREGWLELMRTFTEDFEDYRSEPEQIIDVGGDQVLVVIRSDATGRGSRAHVEMRTGMIFRLTEGRIVRVDVFVEPADALRAAGLSE